MFFGLKPLKTFLWYEVPQCFKKDPLGTEGITLFIWAQQPQYMTTNKPNVEDTLKIHIPIIPNLSRNLDWPRVVVTHETVSCRQVRARAVACEGIRQGDWVTRRGVLLCILGFIWQLAFFLSLIFPFVDSGCFLIWDYFASLSFFWSDNGWIFAETMDSGTSTALLRQFSKFNQSLARIMFYLITFRARKHAQPSVKQTTICLEFRYFLPKQRKLKLKPILWSCGNLIWPSSRHISRGGE